MENTDINYYVNMAYEMIIEYAPKVILALVVLIIGLWLAKKLTNTARKGLVKRNMDPSLIPFLSGIIGAVLKVMVILSVISLVGVPATSFIAVLGAAGLAIGLALSGTLQNFAGGVIILIIKPIKVGDFIEAQGHSGTVHEIQIFNTILKTPNNVTIFLPNGPVSTGSITNYSTEPTRRHDWTFGIGYGDDTDKAIAALKQLVEEDERIMKDPEPFFAVKALADSSVNIAVRCWTQSGDFWPVNFDMQGKVYKKFNEDGINIPFPQMDVHLHKEEA